MRRVSVRNTPRSGGMVASLAQDVLQHAAPATAGVGGLGDLGELQRIAEQDEVVRRTRRGKRVGQRQLAGLVDDQHVDRRVAHVAAGEQPRRAGDQVELGLWRTGALAVV